jgi:hypothetical protein
LKDARGIVDQGEAGGLFLAKIINKEIDFNYFINLLIKFIQYINLYPQET